MVLYFFQRFKSHKSSSSQKTILLTGAAGRIGTSLYNHLGDRYHFRCLDLRTVPDVKDLYRVDVTKFKPVLKAMQGVDAVIHLVTKYNTYQPPWKDVYSSGINGTYNVFEAARQAGVKQIIYASTIHVSGWREVLKETHITPDQPVRPDSIYGVGKVFGEALGQYFCDRYGLSVVCLRIGAFKEKPEIYGNDIANWCSPRDLAQLVRRSLEHENLGFQIFYGISGNTRRYWDISNAQAILGYEPEDNAENVLKDFDDISRPSTP